MCHFLLRGFATMELSKSPLKPYSLVKGEEEVKHERLRILMSYDDRSLINSSELAEKWKVSPQMLGGLVSAAKLNKSLRGELMEGYGYRGEDFPEWWYRGIEEEVPPPPPLKEPSRGGGGGVEDSLEGSALENTVSKGPGFTVRTPSSSPTPPSSSLEQVQVLAGRGVTYDESSNRWLKITPQGRARVVSAIHALRT
jgi:hypothetical protein